MRRIRSVLFACLAACSGGGSSPSSSGGQNGEVLLVVDTAVGITDSLDGRLSVVALERPDGSFTGNLLAAESAVTLADPLGSGSLLALRGVPEGDYVAMRLLFAAGSLSSRDGNGRQHACELERHDLRVGFEDSFRRGRGTDDWLELRHRRSPEIRRGGSSDLWLPLLGLRRGSYHHCHELQVTIALADLASRTITGTLRTGSGTTAVTLRIQAGALLTERSERRLLSDVEFFARATPGRVVYVRGALQTGGTLLVTSAELRHANEHRGENEVLARIDALLPGNQFTAQVLAVRRGALAGLQLPKFTVDAAGARIQHSHGSHQSLPFSALQVGMLVEIEWDGPADLRPVPAREVEIEDHDGGSSQHPESEGAVAEVLPAQNVLVAVPRRDDPLIVGGRAVSSARVRIGAGTYLFRDDDGRTPITLAQVRAGERVWFRGAVQQDGDVLATWVRVRSER
jgi:hypothetical protein